MSGTFESFAALAQEDMLMILHGVSRGPVKCYKWSALGLAGSVGKGRGAGGFVCCSHPLRCYLSARGGGGGGGGTAGQM